MRKDDELYVELNLSKMLELYLETEYNIDRFGNIVFEDKNKAKERINKEISKSAEKLDVSEEEIRKYLIQLYTNKCSNEEYIKEGTELISILEEPKTEIQEENRDTNKGENEAR